MTAYGRAALQTKKARWTVEIASVNRKGLDLHIHLPLSLLFLDPAIRKWVGQVAERGSITVRVSCQLQHTSHLISQLKAEKKLWEKVASELGISQDSITLPFLLSQISPQEVKLDSAAFEKEASLVWKKASQAWIRMREQEGKILLRDIVSRLKTIQIEMQALQKEIPQLLKGHLAKLSGHMERLKLTLDLDQLKKEAVLQADRDDVTEEMIRLTSHIEQMGLYLQSSDKSVGRTLDFLAQEMGREIGTLMAKAGSSTIAQQAVRMKSEVEKIREQVQNIE